MVIWAEKRWKGSLPALLVRKRLWSRQQIVSGTHAINLGLSGLLRPGDELIFATGLPYDTLRTVCGIDGNVPGNLQDYGVKVKAIPLLPEGQIDQERLVESISNRTRMVAFQRSCGYEDRRSPLPSNN